MSIVPGREGKRKMRRRGQGGFVSLSKAYGLPVSTNYYIYSSPSCLCDHFNDERILCDGGGLENKRLK